VIACVVIKSVLLHLHTHLLNGRLSWTTQVSRYKKDKTNLDFTEARDSEWHWHQLGHMQVCTSLQTDNHASTPPLSFFYDRMPFLLPNQQRQSTEGIYCTCLGIFSVLCVCRHFQSHPTLCHTASLFQMIAECVFLPGE